MMSGAQAAALVAAALAGDEKAFRALVEAHLRAVYLIALAVVGQTSDAEDVAQISFVRAFERLHTCREQNRFSGWVLRIARNCALNWAAQRRTRRLGEQSADEPVHPAPAPDPLLRAKLLSALSALTVTQRAVVLLHDLEGFSHAEIGEGLEISEITSRQHLFLARRRLRALLTEEGIKESEHGT